MTNTISERVRVQILLLAPAYPPDMRKESKVKQSIVSTGTKIGAGSVILVAAALVLGMLLFNPHGRINHAIKQAHSHLQDKAPLTVHEPEVMKSKEVPKQTSAAVDD
ncbi:hypothetical protein [Rhodoferax sp. GW822-FHT02A01]|uniref:hypothetical protein n=1 Tax=Rhodoferax sp. GW822-FHT02A01 TaxID=3141537 RepID=UPI00315DA9F4